MRNATLLTLGAFMALHGTAFSQTLKQVDCAALKKQSDGTYLVLKDTSILDVRDNTVSVSKGTVIGPHSITINGWSGRDLIEQKCSGAAVNESEAAAAPPPLPSKPKFFYNDGGKPSGPINISDLKAKLAEGTIRRETLVWKSGTPNWVPAREVPELATGTCAAGCNPSPDDGRPDIRSFFVGTWATEAPGPGGAEGPAKMVVTLGQDGKVQGTYTVHLAGSGATAVIPVNGTWSVAPLSEKKANLTLDLHVRDNAGQERGVNQTVAMEIVDQDTVRDTAQGTVTKRVKI
jgi:hypothetical protein